MHSSTEDPFELPKAFPEVKELDTLLRCGICYDTMKTAMMLQQCSHNYCSLCIRKYMTFKTQCPTCRVTASDLDLRNNRVLDQVIKHFLSVRSRLLQQVSEVESDGSSRAPDATVISDKKVTAAPVQSATNKGEDVDKEDQDFLPKRRRPCLRLHNSSDSDSTDDEFVLAFTPLKSSRKRTTQQPKTQPVSSMKEKIQLAETTNNSNNSCNKPELSTRNSFTLGSPEFKSFDCATPKLSTSKSTGSSAGLGSLPSTSNGSSTPGSNSKKVECPVCGVSVPAKHINLHLDRCLNAEHSEPRQSVAPLKRKRLPKLVYNLLSDKELRKKLTEYKLSTQGDRQSLVKRHHQFTLSYNAECDSLHPKSVEELVKELQQSEKTKSQLCFSPAVSRSNSLQINKGASTSEVENAQKHYVKQHKSQFAQLIAETKARMKKMQKVKTDQQVKSSMKKTDSLETITLDEEQDNAAEVEDREQDKGPDLPKLKLTLDNMKKYDTKDSKVVIWEKPTSSLCDEKVVHDVVDEGSEECSVNKARQRNIIEETSSCVQSAQTTKPQHNKPGVSMSSVVHSDDSTQDLFRGGSGASFQNSGSLLSGSSNNNNNGDSGCNSRSGAGSDNMSECLGWLSQRSPPRRNSESNTRDVLNSRSNSPNFDMFGGGSGDVSFEGLLKKAVSSVNDVDDQNKVLQEDIDRQLSDPEQSDGDDDFVSPVLQSRAVAHGGNNVESNGLASSENTTISPEEAPSGDIKTLVYCKDTDVSKEFCKNIAVAEELLLPETKIAVQEATHKDRVSPVKSPAEKTRRKRKLRSSRSPKEQQTAVDVPKKKLRKEVRASKDEENVIEGEGVSTRRQLRARKK